MAKSSKPKITMIMVDDVCIWNPPIQKPDTFTLDDALQAMSNIAAGG